MYKLNDRDLRRIDRQVNDIANGTERWIGFKNGAIQVLSNPQKTYAVWFAEKEEDIVCATGINSGSCSPDDCEFCEVKKEAEKAISEIKAGLRHEVNIKRRCKMYIDFNDDGSIKRITQVLR